ncbi:phosphatidylserine decarboxylase family protein [Flammeovirgaceae bacterium SG7u.111]|nr:phosphatidylserine decarboxylase family protein [Flammeovirgaceae bacterium SG7u.132]WPO35693.1 phosphatidylserine decarboxylase family protein [Flammeovirgaceae bacterium SG7u.111]
MTIHKEGHLILIVTLVVLGAITVGVKTFFPDPAWIYYLTATASLVFFLLILQFFRSPKRIVPVNTKHVIAPADGKVVVIEETVENEYFKEARRQVSIFMSPVNVHINRNPIAGIVKYFKYHPGKYLVAWHPKSSTENERTTTVVQHESGIEILFRQIAGAMARRIRWYINEGDKVDQGEEFGFIKFGSRVDIFLPLDAEVKVSLEQKTVGGQTVIAELA